MTRAPALRAAAIVVAALALSTLSAFTECTSNSAASGVAVGPQYSTTHVYIAVADFDAFVKSLLNTFGGNPSKRTVVNVLPVSSSAEWQYLRMPVGAVSIFAYQTPIPFPYGQERTGYLVSDMNAAITQARAAGAEVIVEPFKDPIGMDAVIQWPGGVKMQLYCHFAPSQAAPLDSVPDNRVYLSADAADNFVDRFVRFSHGTVVADDKHADADEIGRPAETYRRIRIASLFGNIEVRVSDGHLPYPFGYDITGYEVADLDATLARAKASEAKVLYEPHSANSHAFVIVEFPGGVVAELHSTHSAIRTKSTQK